MADKKVRVAIVGLGFGAEFIPIYQAHPNAEMYAACRRNKAELDKCGDKFGVKVRYADFNDLLKDPNVDAVHINSPIPDHAPQSLAALKAGKHVACTVPMATNIEDCKKIVDLAKRTGLKYMMMETVVYAREYLFMKDLHLIQDAARTVGAPLPLTDVAERLYGAVAEGGHGGDDLAVVVRAIEALRA